MRTLAILLLAIGASSSATQAGIIVADPDSYPNGTNITYGFPGVTLWEVWRLSGHELKDYVYARDDGLHLHSTGTTSFGRDQVFATTWFSSFYSQGADLLGEFASPTRFLQLDFISNEACQEYWDVGLLEIFDSGKNSLGVFATGDLHGYGTIGTISITRPTADIAFFIATGSPARGDDLGLDNLRYEFGDGPPPVPIPEPLSLLVWAIVVSAGALFSTIRRSP